MIAFPYPGGKVRIRKELFKFFPEEGHHYIEPFVGRGNIFFEFYKRSVFEQYIINDIRIARFFKSLKIADLTLLPSKVDESDFDYWYVKWLMHDPIAYVLEPKITYRGKGYDAGWQIGRYQRSRYLATCAEAQNILQNDNVIISSSDYVFMAWDLFGPEDFIYCDPPYYETDGVGLGNIDHLELLQKLTDTNSRWAVSGYLSDLYLTWLGEPALKLERGHEMCDDRGATTIECLWIR